MEVKDFLSLVDNGLTESEWKITCLKFAPNDPTQNLIEDIWLQAKRWIRECYHLCKTFATINYIFEFVTHCQILDFPKLYFIITANSHKSNRIAIYTRSIEKVRLILSNSVLRSSHYIH